MNPVVLIAAKRDGRELTSAEIEFLVDKFVREEVADYQMAAWAMAVYLRGMTVAETAALTGAMLHSGATLQWNSRVPKVDKHSTGGIGDKTSLILAPLLACNEVQVPMISGRGLGATGGTLDKLEAVAGYRTALSLTEVKRLTEQIGCVIAGASAELVPADKRLYALRDVTATVASIPLITASIMSKKLAEGLDALVLDVKFGSGAFMKTLEQARRLAESLVETGQRMGVKTRAVLSDMNQPLGRMAGNSLEVEEALQTLQGCGPADLRELTLELGCELLHAVGQGSLEELRERLAGQLDDGQAMRKFEEMVDAQGGDLSTPRALAPAKLLTSRRAGFLQQIDTEAVGLAIIELGGGRRTLKERIDPGVGLEMLVRLGDTVEVGQPLMRVYARPGDLERVEASLLAALRIHEDCPPPSPLILERLG